MKKYQWNDAKLKKKSLIYERLMLGIGAIVLVLFFVMESLLTWLLLLLLTGVVVCYVLSWQVRVTDSKLNQGEQFNDLPSSSNKSL